MCDTPSLCGLKAQILATSVLLWKAGQGSVYPCGQPVWNLWKSYNCQPDLFLIWAFVLVLGITNCFCFNRSYFFFFF